MLRRRGGADIAVKRPYKSLGYFRLFIHCHHLTMLLVSNTTHPVWLTLFVPRTLRFAHKAWPPFSQVTSMSNRLGQTQNTKKRKSSMLLSTWAPSSQPSSQAPLHTVSL